MAVISRIKIRDFKSIRGVDLQLDPVTILLGRSGAGKSNLVQAIRFLRNLLLDFNDAVGYEHGWQRIVPVGEPRPETTIEVWFSVPGEEPEYSYRIGFGTPGRSTFSGQVQLREEELKLGGQRIFRRARKEMGQWEWEELPKLSTTPSHSEGPMLGLFPALQQVVFANAALSTGIGYYHFPSATLTSPVSGHGHNLLQKVQGLSDTAANYKEVMRGITQDFHHPNVRKNLLASLKTVSASIESVELDSLTNPQSAVISHKAADRIFSLSLEQESDGLRRFYAHLLALYQTPSKLTLIFEEPENAIFPGALSLLADEFKAAPREDRGQVILTTHNPILLDSFDVENVRTVEMHDGGTVVGRVSKEQRDAVRDKLLTTGDLLMVDQARLDETDQSNSK